MVERQQNWLGQQRVDVPHIRSLESSVAADLDLLAGKMMAGKMALILKGFNLITTGAIGAAVTNLKVRTGSGLLMHYAASEAGTIFGVADDGADEQLSPANAKVTGSFTASQTNFIGLDLSRAADDSTADNVQFLEPTSDAEISKTVPLARTMSARFIISTADFSSQATVLPLAKVVTDASNNVVSIADARQMMFRLADGGDSPNVQSAYTWPGSRYENATGDVFAGGDKSITDLKTWMDAAMTRMWELGGGERWFSATADRNVNLVWNSLPFTNGENFEVVASNLHWKGMRYMFDNSSGYVNDLNDQTGDSVGLTDLANGECLYVDLDRTKFHVIAWAITTAYLVGDLVYNDTDKAYECITAGTSAGAGGPTGTGLNITDNTVHWKYVGPGHLKLSAVKAPLITLGSSLVPGSRQILAWKTGNQVFTKSWRYPVGTTFQPATTTSLGMVELNQTAGLPLTPVVVSIMTNGKITVVATGGNSAAAYLSGNGSGGGVVGIGGATDGSSGGNFTSAATNGHGTTGIATGTGSGVIGMRGVTLPASNAAIAGRATTGYGLYIEGETAAYIKGLKSPGFCFEVLAADGTAGGGSQGGTAGKISGGGGTTGTASAWNGGGGLQIFGGLASSGTGVVGATGGGALFASGGSGSDGNGENGIGTGRAGGTGGYGAQLFGALGGTGANGSNTGGNGGSGGTALTVTGGAGGTPGSGPSGGTQGAGGDAFIATGGAGGLSGGRGAVITGGNGAGGHGAIITGGTAGKGAVVTAGGGNNEGVDATASGTAAGVKATGGGSGGYGVDAIGTGTVAGVKATAGTASTGAAPKNAIDCTNGNIVLSGGVDPNAGVGLTDTITPKNICKMWADITVPSTDGNCTLNDGFNVGTPTVATATDKIIVPFVNAMASTFYFVAITNQDVGVTTSYYYYVFAKSTTQIEIKAKFWNGAAIADANLGTGGQDVHILVSVTGAQ